MGMRTLYIIIWKPIYLVVFVIGDKKYELLFQYCEYGAMNLLCLSIFITAK